MIDDFCTLFGERSKRASSSKGKPVNKGTVNFNGQKGYGFISPDGRGNEVFIHVTALGESRNPKLG
jgi:'Cold-shock' DNA-binding domain